MRRAMLQRVLFERHRVRRDPEGRRSVVLGWDARRGIAVVLVYAAVAVSLGIGVLIDSLETLAIVSLAVLLLAPLGAGVGFRVTIEARGVTVTKHWLGLPYRTRTVPLEEAHAEVYWVFESPEPEGALVSQRREPRGFRSERWILGTSKNATRLAAALGEELAFVRSAIAPTPTYRA